jgi:hypothetical protein
MSDSTNAWFFVGADTSANVTGGTLVITINVRQASAFIEFD